MSVSKVTKGTPEGQDFSSTDSSQGAIEMRDQRNDQIGLREFSQ